MNTKQAPPPPQVLMRTNRLARTQQSLIAASANGDALLRIEVVLALTGLGKTHVYGLMARGQFPQPIRLSARCVRWRAAAVSAWIELAAATSA